MHTALDDHHDGPKPQQNKAVAVPSLLNAHADVYILPVWRFVEATTAHFLNRDK